MSHPDSGGVAVAATPFVRISRDLAIALLLASFLAALYAATQQSRLFGDGSPIVRYYLETRGTRGTWTHVLYFPVARALERLVQPENPIDALQLVSILGGAAGAGFTYLIARGLGARRAAALGATLLLALSPAWWFFSTAIEVYGLHLACVALAALVTLYAPWQRPVAAGLVAGAALPLVFLSHKAGLFLGPGFVALAQLGRRRRGLAPLGWRPLLLGVGPWFLACFLFAAVHSARMQSSKLAALVRDNADFVAGYGALSQGTVFLSLWVLPLGLLAPLTVAATFARVARGWPVATLVAWSLPSVVFFTAFGYAERGGYALSSALFWSALAALAFAPRTRAEHLAWAFAVAVQAVLGWRSLCEWDAPEWERGNRTRAVAVERALGRQGTLFALNLRFQEVEADLPGVFETNLYPRVRACVLEGIDPEDFARALAEEVAAARARGPVGIELTFEPNLAGRPEAEFVAAVRERLQRDFAPALVSDASWPMLVVPALDVDKVEVALQP